MIYNNHCVHHCAQMEGILIIDTPWIDETTYSPLTQPTALAEKLLPMLESLKQS